MQRFWKWVFYHECHESLRANVTNKIRVIRAVCAVRGIRDLSGSPINGRIVP
jgi:hypothetical protein